MKFASAIVATLMSSVRPQANIAHLAIRSCGGDIIANYKPIRARKLITCALFAFSHNQGMVTDLAPAVAKTKQYTGAILQRTRPKTYRKVVELLAEPGWPDTSIAKACKVSDKTVRAIKTREAATIDQRKAELVTMFSDTAVMGVTRVQDTVSRASTRDAVIASGVAVDKMLALLGQSPTVQIANVIMPSDADRAERRELHDKLDAIAARLNA